MTMKRISIENKMEHGQQLNVNFSEHLRWQNGAQMPSMVSWTRLARLG